MPRSEAGCGGGQGHLLNRSHSRAAVTSRGHLAPSPPAAHRPPQTTKLCTARLRTRALVPQRAPVTCADVLSQAGRGWRATGVWRTVP